MTTQTKPKTANAIGELRDYKIKLLVNRQQYDNMTNDLKVKQTDSIVFTMIRGLHRSPNHVDLRHDLQSTKSALDADKAVSYAELENLVNRFNQVDVDDKNVTLLDNATLPMGGDDTQQTSTNASTGNGTQSHDSGHGSAATKADIENCFSSLKQELVSRKEFDQALQNVNSRMDAFERKRRFGGTEPINKAVAAGVIAGVLLTVLVISVLAPLSWMHLIVLWLFGLIVALGSGYYAGKIVGNRNN